MYNSFDYISQIILLQLLYTESISTIMEKWTTNPVPMSFTDINIIYYFLHNDVLMFFHLVLPEIVKFWELLVKHCLLEILLVIFGAVLLVE